MARNVDPVNTSGGQGMVSMQLLHCPRAVVRKFALPGGGRKAAKSERCWSAAVQEEKKVAMCHVLRLPVRCVWESNQSS